MIVKRVDLYSYYNIKRNDAEKGYLNIYCKENSYEVSFIRRYPAILIIPGGAYNSNSFREGEPVAIKFISNNIQSFVLEYTTRKFGVYPAQVLEGYLALRYIKENAKEFNIDDSLIGVIGFSAGGHLAGLISNNHLLDKFNDLINHLPEIKFGAYIYPVNYFNKDGSHNFSFKNLTHNDPLIMSNLDFDKMITKNSPLAFFVSSFEDGLVNYKNTLSLVNQYSKLNLPFEVHIFNKGDHGVSLGDLSVYKKSHLSLERKVFGEWFNLLLNFLEVNKICIKDII